MEEIENKGLFRALSEGIFAGVKRPIEGGKGLDGVVVKDKNYYNPVIELMLKELKEGDN